MLPSSRVLPINVLLRSRSISNVHIDNFKLLIGMDCVLTEDIGRYQKDWLEVYSGGSVVCIPKSTGDVSALLKYCDQNSIGIVPQGGNTGLVGGSVARCDDEVILSLEKMNSIIEIDEDSSVLVCESGCVLQELESAVSDRGYTVPLDLGAKGSCMIGGNISTNAGGLRVLRYGSLHHNVLGLEVVLPNGDVLDLLSKLRKDNTGYHLKHMFIGAEGTLGVITKAAIQLAAKPVSVNVLLFRVSNFQDVKALLRAARKSLSEILSAFEFMDERSVMAVAETSPMVFRPITVNFPSDSSTEALFVLIETSGFHSSGDMTRVEEFVAAVTTAEPTGAQSPVAVLGVVLAQNEKQCRDIWAIRETVPVSLAQLSRPGASMATATVEDISSSLMLVNLGKLFKYDISLSLDDMAEVVQGTVDGLRRCGYNVLCQSMLPGVAEYAEVISVSNPTAVDMVESPVTLQVHNFGHMGDNNLHLNVLMRPQDITLKQSADSAFSENQQQLRKDILNFINEDIDRVVFELVASRRGSISAEHGIGQKNLNHLETFKSSCELSVMRRIKQTFDKNLILNPEKVIRMTTDSVSHPS